MEVINAELITSIFQVCVIPLLGILTTYLVKWIKLKSTELQAQTDNVLYKKYIGMLDSTIIDCVIATNQTYVDALKEKGEFTAEAQKEAFNKTCEAVLTILSAEANEYLTAAIGDLQTYIFNKIEAEVNANKSLTLG